MYSLPAPRAPPDHSLTICDWFKAKTCQKWRCVSHVHGQYLKNLQQISLNSGLLATFYLVACCPSSKWYFVVVVCVLHIIVFRNDVSFDGGEDRHSGPRKAPQEVCSAPSWRCPDAKNFRPRQSVRMATYSSTFGSEMSGWGTDIAKILKNPSKTLIFSLSL